MFIHVHVLRAAFQMGAGPGWAFSSQFPLPRSFEFRTHMSTKRILTPTLETCPNSYTCDLPQISMRLAHGQEHRDTRNCRVYSCHCSNKITSSRFGRKKMEGCTYTIVNNTPKCSFNKQRCRDLNTNKCAMPRLVPKRGFTMRDCDITCVG